MKLPAYPRTKPSGVAWLGDVPEHWAPIALRRTSTRYAGGTPDRSNDSYWEDGTIPWINSGAVNQGLVTEPSAYITEDAYKNSSARWVAKGALVMALAGQGKTKGMVAQTGIATTCNQSMAAICPAPPMETRYLYWLLVSQYEHIRNMAGGEARDGLNLEILGSIPCLKVPPTEQQAIAAYLDRETGRLDRLVAKKRELIERLKEKRTAMISRTVTRGLPAEAAAKAGLPANPPLTPSGLDWLGDIPAHWEVKKLKYLASHESDTGIQIGPFGGMLTELSYDDEGEFKVYGQENTLSGDFTKGQRWLTRDQFHTLSNYHIATEDVLFTRKGSIGGCTVVPAGIQPGIIDSDTIRLRVNRSAVNISFILYAFKFSAYLQAQVQEMKRGAILSGLNTATIANLSFIVPPLPEQAEIAAYLDEETAKLDALVGKVEEAVERLQEYRTALITAAVTGKIDVPTDVR